MSDDLANRIAVKRKEIEATGLCQWPYKLPDPVITEHDGFLVLRDDLLPGGTKRRAIHTLFGHASEYVYASPVFGYAQLALAYAAADHGKRSTIFCAARKELHPMTCKTRDAGATIVQVPCGYLTVVTARAREHCERTGAVLLPFGLNHPAFIGGLAAVARALPVTPSEVWTVVGSGVLTRALQVAWPGASFHAVQVGAVGDAGSAVVHVAPERYEQAAKWLPPFPSCVNYDAKVWGFVKRHASPGALVWNVGS